MSTASGLVAGLTSQIVCQVATIAILHHQVYMVSRLLKHRGTNVYSKYAKFSVKCSWQISNFITCKVHYLFIHHIASRI